jgi:hypothetical protein
MKTIFRFLSLAVVFAGLGASAAFAQDACADVDGQTAVYTKFTELYNKTALADRRSAIDTGKQFLEKYGACGEALKDQIDFVKAQTTRLEGVVSKQAGAEEMKAMFARFDASITGEKYDESYAAGKEILAKQPDNLNIMIPLGQIGLYQSYNKNYKYNEDTLRYAQQALTVLKSGKELPKKNKAGVPVAGAFQFECAKEDCINDLNYAIGYINYYAKDNKKAALPYYYDLTQTGGKYKTEPRVFATVGNYYVDDAKRIGSEIEALITKQKAAATDEEKATIDTEIKAKIALFKGYTERSLDAYSRAYKVAKDDTPENKTYKASLYTILKDLYQKRFEKTDGLDAYIAATANKPLPTPTSEVTPVSDPEPAKTTGTAAPAAAATPAPTKPVATTKPSAAVASTAVPAATTAAPVKKPVAVKKNR